MLAKIFISPLTLRQEQIGGFLKLGNTKNPSPDLLLITQEEKLGVEIARKIKEHFNYKPLLQKGRICILESADNLTPEAQNALLKTIEELPEYGQLILGATSENSFLPTILSRCEIVYLNLTPNPTSHPTPTSEVGYEEDIKKLRASGIQERFEYIEKLKDKEEFLKALVSYFHQDLNSHPKGVKIEFIKDLMEAEKWANQNVNLRGILEYLMLVL